MEKIQSFVVDDNIRKLPFYVELAEITFPDANYSIYGDNSEIYVLEYVIDGCGTVEIDKQTFFPSKGDVYLPVAITIFPQGSSPLLKYFQSFPGGCLWNDSDRNKLPDQSTSGQFHP